MSEGLSVLFENKSTMIFAALACTAFALILALWMSERRRIGQKLVKTRRQLEALLSSSAHSKKQMEATFNAIPDGIAVIDRDYNIIRTNASYNKITQKDPKTTLLRKCHKILKNLDTPCLECPLSNSQYADGYTTALEGKKYQVEVASTTSGNMHNYIETLRDVSRFEELQTRLRRSERLASLGTMVAGITHEINNPLSGISGNSQLMIRTPEKYGLNEKGLDRIKVIFQSVERATRIVNDLLYLSKPSLYKFKKINLGKLVRDTLASLDESLQNEHNFLFRFPDKELKIWGHKSQLASVIGKIVINSHHAILEKKKQIPDHAGEIKIESYQKDKSVVLNIVDNGCGIPAENLLHIYDPFYTTKDPGAGPGLGLSICHRIITEHSGSINVFNVENGIQAQFVFPRKRPKYA